MHVETRRRFFLRKKMLEGQLGLIGISDDRMGNDLIKKSRQSFVMEVRNSRSCAKKEEGREDKNCPCVHVSFIGALLCDL
jgi:hypothetical protein